MRHRRVPAVAALVLVAVTWAFAASACDHEKNSAAAAQVASTKAATCTAEQMAACKAKGVSAMAASSGSCCARKASAAVASANACAAHKNASAVAASSSGCSGMLGAVFAISATGSADHCAGAKSARMASATSGGSCSANKASAYDAMAAGQGCSSHASKSAKNTMAVGHGDCEACSDMLSCRDQLSSIGTQIQAVPLKNGVMLVYTANAPSGVRAVQATMGHRSDRLAAITASGDRATLCPDCKSLRTAVANGKLTREIVNIEGGCLTLMTSTDPAMVARLQAMAGLQTARTKS